MNIGFIGFGEVNKKFAELLEEHRLISSTEGRSQKTVENIKNSNVEVMESFEEVATQSDILISATSPKQSLENSRRYGKLCRGTYLDLNNISPTTAIEISRNTNDFVDSAIIGGINNDFTLFLAGESAEGLKFLEKYLKIKIISKNVVDASRLKLLRSIYTKSVSAVLIEAMAIAERHNLQEELLDTIAISEGENFRKSAISRIENTKNSSKRKKEEMMEILEYFSEEDMEMVRATIKKLSNI